MVTKGAKMNTKTAQMPKPQANGRVLAPKRAETEDEICLRVYGTTEVDKLSTMEMLRRNSYAAKKLRESMQQAKDGLVDDFVPYDVE